MISSPASLTMLSTLAFSASAMMMMVDQSEASPSGPVFAGEEPSSLSFTADSSMRQFLVRLPLMMMSGHEPEMMMDDDDDDDTDSSFEASAFNASRREEFPETYDHGMRRRDYYAAVMSQPTAEPTTEIHDDDDLRTWQSSSSSLDDDGDEKMELPSELAELIASAQEVAGQDDEPPLSPLLPSSIRTNDGVVGEVRYYPTYGYAEGGELCSSKSSSAFEGWEESHASLDDCCGVAFSWDYDSCMGFSDGIKN